MCELWSIAYKIYYMRKVWNERTLLFLAFLSDMRFYMEIQICIGSVLSGGLYMISVVCLAAGLAQLRGEISGLLWTCWF